MLQSRAFPKTRLHGDQLPVIAWKVSKELPETLAFLAVVGTSSGRSCLGRRRVLSQSTRPMVAKLAPASIKSAAARAPSSFCRSSGVDHGRKSDVPAAAPEAEVARVIAGLPKVTIRTDKTPENLAPGRFLAAMVARVLSTTPVNMHGEARKRRT